MRNFFFAIFIFFTSFATLSSTNGLFTVYNKNKVESLQFSKSGISFSSKYFQEHLVENNCNKSLIQKFKKGFILSLEQYFNSFSGQSSLFIFLGINKKRKYKIGNSSKFYQILKGIKGDFIILKRRIFNICHTNV